MCTPVFTDALIYNSQAMKKRKFLYSAIKRKFFSWMNLEGIMVSEIISPSKDKYCMDIILHLHEVSKIVKFVERE